MRGSLRLATVAGIGVYVHVTFVVFVAWLLYARWAAGGSFAAAVAGVLLFLALFGCVVLHEFGHALTARRFGIRTRDITLLPIGGVARMDRMPDVPIQEIWVALAGPAVNVVIATALYAALRIAGVARPLAIEDWAKASFAQQLLYANLALVVFNLLPAFPMDGGRVLRAWLAMRMEHARATQLAALVGQTMAFVFGVAGLLFNPMLLFIALFVWLGAAQESGVAQVRAALGGIPVHRAMITDFRALGPRDSVARAVELLLQGSQQDFPVVDGGAVLGVLTRADVLQALAEGRPQSAVGAVMRREFATAQATEMLDEAFRRLQECACPTMPVFHAGELVGLLTAENIGEFLMVQAAKARARSEA